MRNTDEVQSWLFPVEPYEEESLSHFLGRFRRLNYLSPSALGDLAGIGGVVARWEKFHLNPFPTDKQCQALAEVVAVDSFRLRHMLPPQGIEMKCKPIRLCGACYEEVPCHRMKWQYKSVWKCDHHNLKLISKCPNCGAKFKFPALWEFGCCDRCRLPFPAIAAYQKAI